MLNIIPQFDGPYHIDRITRETKSAFQDWFRRGFGAYKSIVAEGRESW